MKVTQLTRLETAFFFKQVQQANIIYKDKSYLSNVDLSMAIQALTGYSSNKIADDLSKKTIHRKGLENIKRLIKEVNRLLDIELKNKKGGE